MPASNNAPAVANGTGSNGAGRQRHHSRFIHPRRCTHVSPVARRPEAIRKIAAADRAMHRPLIGMPWPQPTTVGRKSASFSNDFRVARQSMLNGAPARDSSFLPLDQADPRIHVHRREARRPPAAHGRIRGKRKHARANGPASRSTPSPATPATRSSGNSRTRSPKSRARYGMKRERNAIAPPIVGSGGG